MDNFDFEDPSDPDVPATPPAVPEAPATPARAGAGATAVQSPPTPTVININLFGTVNRTIADVLRDVLNGQGHVLNGQGQPEAQYPTFPWQVPARRPRGRPPGPQTLRNRFLAQAQPAVGRAVPVGGGYGAFGFPFTPPPPPPAAAAATAPATAPAPADPAVECLVCRRGGPTVLGILPCRHIVCEDCVTRVRGRCPDPLCNHAFTPESFMRFR